MRLKFNAITSYSRMLTIFFVFGVFPSLIFYVGKKYAETVSVLTYAQTSAYELHDSGAYEQNAYAGPGSLRAERDIEGEWINVNDTKYRVRFRNINTFYDIYDANIIASGSWLLLGSLANTPHAISGLENGLFLQKNILDRTEKEDKQFYKIISLDEDRLVLKFLDAEQTTSFSKKK